MKKLFSQFFVWEDTFESNSPINNTENDLSIDYRQQQNYLISNKSKYNIIKQFCFGKKTMNSIHLNMN